MTTKTAQVFSGPNLTVAQRLNRGVGHYFVQISRMPGFSLALAEILF